MSTVTNPKRNGAADKARMTTAGGGTSEPPADIRHLAIPRPRLERAIVELVGVSPLIMHRWSEKAIQMLEDSQTGKAKAQKSAKQPEEEMRAAAYVVPGRESLPDGTPGKYRFPAPAFKHAFLYGVSQLDDVKKFPKTKTTGWVFVDADPVIGFQEMVMRSDIGRIGQGTSMIYRPMFIGWTADLEITYNANTITIAQVASLFDLGGTGGVGEWRPTSPKNKSGDHGRFRVGCVREIESE